MDVKYQNPLEIKSVINLCYSTRAKNRVWRIELHPILKKFDIFIVISFNWSGIFPQGIRSISNLACGLISYPLSSAFHISCCTDEYYTYKILWHGSYHSIPSAEQNPSQTSNCQTQEKMAFTLNSLNWCDKHLFNQLWWLAAVEKLLE